MRPWFGQPRLVLAAAVLEVEDRVARLAVGVVAGRGVDEDAPPVPGSSSRSTSARGPRRAARPSAGRVDALLRDLDPAGVLAGAVERLARGVVHLRAVDEHPVVVEPRHDGSRGRGPEAILALRRGVPLVVEEPEVDLLGVRRLDAEGDAQVVDGSAGTPRPGCSWMRACPRRASGPGPDREGRAGPAGRRTTGCSSRGLPCGRDRDAVGAVASSRRSRDSEESTLTIDVAPQSRPGLAGARACGRLHAITRSLRPSPPGRSGRSGRSPSPARCWRSSASSRARRSGSGPAGPPSLNASFEPGTSFAPLTSANWTPFFSSWSSVEPSS